MSSKPDEQRLQEALDVFRIELPSWGFADTGTRFGKFLQPAAATTTEEKFKDAGQVNRVTGCCPAVAVHVVWDFPDGMGSVPSVEAAAVRSGVSVGSINPNVFQDQIYKNGSLANEDPEVRKTALGHIKESVEIGRALGSRDITLWFADGSNYPGTANIRARRSRFEKGLREIHLHLDPSQRMLIEYKPFEPAFYHTDIADWGMALLLARAAGDQARVLVDTGHHYPTQNIEQIVAWLLADGMLGGFHFNDRRYADDDLTLGSIDPYQVFRIFHEIVSYEWETGARCDLAYMVDQSHNVKGKIEAMIQTVLMAQELYTRALLVDQKRLARQRQRQELVDAEETLKDAFFTDVRPYLREWRRARMLPENPLQHFRESGYMEKITAERAGKNKGDSLSYA